MRFYTGQHRFYCGIDLHARLLAVCVLDQAGAIVYQKQLPAEPQALLEALAPFRPDVAIAVECMFAWYWVADLCATEQIPFLLGHALYMKAIHGGKAKNDDIDAEKIARLLRGGNLPIAYVYPKGMHETRDLLRRRMYLVHKRAELIAHIQITNAQYPGVPQLGLQLDRTDRVDFKSTADSALVPDRGRARSRELQDDDSSWDPEPVTLPCAKSPSPTSLALIGRPHGRVFGDNRE